MKVKVAVVAVVAILAVFLFNSLGSKDPVAVCKEAFEKKFGDKVASFQVKEKTWNSISYDISGYYGDGQWSCALSNNPVEFRSGFLIPRDGKREWFTADDLVGK